MSDPNLSELSTISSHPGYKAILRTVLKTQIKQLVEQLSFYAGEEAILLSASINDGTLSHIGSRSGEIFLNTHNQLKEQFLGFCMRRHKRRKGPHSKPREPRKQASVAKAATTEQPPDASKPHTSTDTHSEVVNDALMSIQEEYALMLGMTSSSASPMVKEINEEQRREIDALVNMGMSAASADIPDDDDDDYDDDDDRIDGNPVIVNQEPATDGHVEYTAEEIARISNNSAGETETYMPDLIKQYTREPSSTKRRLSCISLELKYKSLIEIEEGRKRKSEIVKELNIPFSTLSSWLKHADRIKADYLNNDYGPDRKRVRRSAHPDVEEALLNWVRDAKDHNLEVPPMLMQEKANEFARQLGYTGEQFDCSFGWVDRFKNRYGIASKRKQPYS